MTSFLSGRRSEIPPPLFNDLCRYRHAIFVHKLGWRLPAHGNQDLELDEFDHDEARYVIALREDGTICGTARLLPSTRPYLLELLFPDLAHTLPRRSSVVWELSRFAASISAAPAVMTAGQLSGAVFAESLHLARELGARTLVGAVSRPLERLLRCLGLRTERLGAERTLDGEVVVPCSMELRAQAAWLDERRAWAARCCARSQQRSRAAEQRGTPSFRSAAVV